MPANTINLVIFQVGPVPCGVDSNSVSTVIEPPSHITAIPGSNAFRPGLFSHAGKAVAVYDVRTKFNLPTDQRGKIIITEMNRQLFGFWVDCIQEIISSDKGRSQILPAECPKELFESLFILEDQLIFKTNFEALAKAQVSTQTQKFIAKLVSEEKEKSAIKKAEVIHSNKTKKHPSHTPSNINPIKKKDKQNKTTTTPLNINKPTEKTMTTPVVKATLTTSINKTTKPNIGSPNKPDTPQNTVTPVLQKKSETNTLIHPDKKTLNTPQQPRTISASIKSGSQPKSHPHPQQRNQSNHNHKEQVSIIIKSNEQKKILGSSRDNSSSNGSGAFIILVLLLGLVTGSLYWFITDESETLHKRKVTKNSYKQKTIEIHQSVENSSQFTEIIKETEVLDDNKTIAEDVIPAEVLSTEEITDNNIEEVDLSSGQIENEATANIQKSEDTIIITLSGNDAQLTNGKASNHEEASNNESVIENQHPESDIEETNLTTNLVQPEASAKQENIEIEIITEQQSLSATTTTKSATVSEVITEVIHIVVKGDTLWHIAKRYIHDPFRYNELARLSKIKNPDLIYPGNKVIIRIKNNE